MADEAVPAGATPGGETPPPGGRRSRAWLLWVPFVSAAAAITLHQIPEYRQRQRVRRCEAKGCYWFPSVGRCLPMTSAENPFTDLRRRQEIREGTDPDACDLPPPLQPCPGWDALQAELERLAPDARRCGATHPDAPDPAVAACLLKAERRHQPATAIFEIQGEHAREAWGISLAPDGAKTEIRACPGCRAESADLCRRAAPCETLAPALEDGDLRHPVVECRARPAS